ncbi:hypothetical protein HXX76_013108 [Chlamydomonas incerta]|uniref:Peptidase M48 domain-containing protein n=1 Tax=Chlamydomonas incerta TaxID=51695 RepID=A0A835SV08_CHLIN|nr:hypothetical protein HXX76_013108 [Chlamydomonas incerta]|eukprot:KAG2426351.1 hypothetical protein HXX76_013108 [Chlamydomonas incerta]
MSRGAAALLARRMLHGIAGTGAAAGGATSAVGSIGTALEGGAAAAARRGLLTAGRHTAGGASHTAAIAASAATGPGSSLRTGRLLRAVRGFLGGSAYKGGAASTAVAAGVSAQGAARAATARGLLVGSGGRGAAVAVATAPARPSLQFMRRVWQDGKGYVHFQNRGRTFQLPTGPRARIAAVVLVGGGLSYYLYCREEVPYTHRMHSIMLVSTANEQWMGQQIFQEQKALAQAEGRLLPDSAPDARRVRRLGLAIAAVAGDGAGGGYYGHMQNLQWEFAVIDNPTPNAFVVPGGKVVVFTGLLRLLGHSDDELAAVMAHEVGHILARHTAERMSTLNVWTLMNMVLRLTLGFGLPNVAMYMGIFLPYSRLAEYEADLIGLRLMARACFDPTAAPHMLAKLNAKEKQMQQRGLASAIPAFLRTHPLTEDRVRKVEDDLAAAHQMYLAAGCTSQRSDFARAAAGLFGPAWGGGGGGSGNGNGSSGGGEGEYIRVG